MGDKAAPPTRYWRRDQMKGITPPDLEKKVTFADHIVRARGKRTQYPSVSLSTERIQRFGDQLYRLLEEDVTTNGHLLFEHERVLDELRTQACEGEKGERLKAVAALRYARKNLEGLVDWRFDPTGVESKHHFQWAAAKVRPYFARG